MSNPKNANFKTMRFTSLWIILLLLSGFLSGYFALSNRLTPDEQPDVTVLNIERKKFSANGKSDLSLNIPVMYSSRESELLNPEASLPQTTRLPEKELRTLVSYADECDRRQRLKSPTSRVIRKAFTYHAWACHETARLPEKFLEEAPFMHPNGTSYGYLLWKRDPENFKLKRVLPFLHAGELKLIDKSEITKEFEALAGITTAGMTALHKRNPFVLLKNHVAFLRPDRETEGQGEYRIVHQAVARKSFEESGIRFDEVVSGQSCWLEEGNVCWNIDYDQLYAKKRLPTWVMTLLSLAIGLFLAFHLRSSLKREALDKERQKNAFRILAHELRTPIAVLRMNVDTLREDFDALPERAKVASLRVFDQVSRLMRLADRSRDYLALETKPAGASKTFSIMDLRSLLEESIEEFKSSRDTFSVTLEPLEEGLQKVNVKGDLYWAGVCVRNLLANATTHGKPPIHVTIKETRSQIEVEVKDSGAILAHAQTEGLGIGLSITENLMKEMGGALKKQESPTRFSLLFKITSGDA